MSRHALIRGSCKGTDMDRSLAPTFTGHIKDRYEACILLEACLTGILSHIPRSPHDCERSHLIKSGNVFVYENNASGTDSWTDGIPWSRDQSQDGLFIYHELDGTLSNTPDQVGAHKLRTGGLVKKTLSVSLHGILHHMVAYHKEEDVIHGILAGPLQNSRLKGVQVRPELEAGIVFARI
ncbi:hypothetical protein Q7P37_007608 [Cladosporium fusiforme]